MRECKTIQNRIEYLISFFMVYLSSNGHGGSAMWFNKESAAGQQGEKGLACKDTVRRGKGLFLNWFILSLLPSRVGFSYLVLLCRCKFRS